MTVIGNRRSGRKLKKLPFWQSCVQSEVKVNKFCFSSINSINILGVKYTHFASASVNHSKIFAFNRPVIKRRAMALAHLHTRLNLSRREFYRAPLWAHCAKEFQVFFERSYNNTGWSIWYHITNSSG